VKEIEIKHIKASEFETKFMDTKKTLTTVLADSNQYQSEAETLKDAFGKSKEREERSKEREKRLSAKVDALESEIVDLEKKKVDYKDKNDLN
jgi:chromosome segregation ATPase